MEVDASLDDDASLTKASSRRTWSAGEDRLLQQIVERYGPRHWSRIAEQMHSRTDWQCRERWQNHLGPQIKKTAWTTEEDTTITRAVEAMGQVRAYTVASSLHGRTDPALRTASQLVARARPLTRLRALAPPNRRAEMEPN
jgi:spore germination cell wall hydrolase CwlJ-like protein